MKIAERIIIVALLLAIIGGATWIYFAVNYEQKELREAVARGEYQIPLDTEEEVDPTDQSEWRTYYPTTIPVTIGSTTVRASVADSLADRIKGLSGTPYLPEGLVKLFVFGTEGEHSIWMKDMNYALDILWVEKGGEIVHVEENISPDTYPESFASPVPAWYVIETNAGFVERSGVSVGDAVVVHTN